MDNTARASRPEEDEIDLQPYLMALLRRWKLVVGVTLLFGVIGAAVSLGTPVTYEATATAAISAPRTQPTPAAKAYLDLATGDRVIASLARDLARHTDGVELLDSDLKGKLKAIQGTDPSIISLHVRDTDPGRASQIAGDWAAVFVSVSNATFNNTADTLKQLEIQSKAAQKQLDQAEADLAAQEDVESVAVLETQLEAQRNDLEALYRHRASLEIAAVQSSRLQNRLSQVDANVPSAHGDDLAILQLQLRALSGPAQVQLAASIPPRSGTVGAQRAYLDGIVSFIDYSVVETESLLSAAQSSVLDTQAKLQTAMNREALLVARRDNARRLIEDLDLKATQASVAAEAGANQARVVPDDALPATSLPGGTTKNVALALVLGLMVGTAGALGMEYLVSRRRTTVPEPSSTT